MRSPIFAGLVASLIFAAGAQAAEGDVDLIQLPANVRGSLTSLCPGIDRVPARAIWKLDFDGDGIDDVVIDHTQHICPRSTQMCPPTGIGGVVGCAFEIFVSQNGVWERFLTDATVQGVIETKRDGSRSVMVVKTSDRFSGYKSGVLVWDGNRIRLAAPEPFRTAKIDDISSELPDSLRAQIWSTVRNLCQNVADTIPSTAVKKLDFDGDGIVDFIIDYGKIPCAAPRPVFCGTDGTCLHDIWISRNGDWGNMGGGNFVIGIEPATDNGRVYIVIEYSRDQCNYGYKSCFQSIFWDNGTVKLQKRWDGSPLATKK